MACCELPERKVLVLFLAFAQIMVVGIFGKIFLNFGTPTYMHDKFKDQDIVAPRRIPNITTTVKQFTSVETEKLKIKQPTSVETEKPKIKQPTSVETEKPTVKQPTSVETEKPTVKQPTSVETEKPTVKELDSAERGVPEVSNLFSKIQGNAVFKHLKIIAREKREFANLLLLVSSAPKRTDRRNAIRETWWSLCKSTNKVKIKCLFITDVVSNKSKYAKTIKEESEKYHDLEFQDLGGGVEFGKRYLYHMLWAVRNFEFDYFLRLDDDYFICLDKLINELPMPPLKMFHWGWVHCINGITRPEESVLLLSRDVIELFLQQNPETMRCHPWADQQLGLWVEDLGLKQKLPYRHDNRLHHHPPSRSLPNVLAEQNICQRRMGLHGSYPETMRKLWQNRGTYKLKPETLVQNSQICKSDLNFQWGAFGGPWRYEPKLCKTDPKWDTSKQGTGESYGGREEGYGK